MAFVKVPQCFPDCCHTPQLQSLCTALSISSEFSSPSSLSYQQQESQSQPSAQDKCYFLCSINLSTQLPLPGMDFPLLFTYSNFFRELKVQLRSYCLQEDLSDSAHSNSSPSELPEHPLASNPVANSWGQGLENRWTEDCIRLESVASGSPLALGLFGYQQEAVST